MSILPKVTQLTSHRTKIYTQGRLTPRPTLLYVNPFLYYIFKNHAIFFKREAHLRKTLGLPPRLNQSVLSPCFPNQA